MRRLIRLVPLILAPLALQAQSAEKGRDMDGRGSRSIILAMNGWTQPLLRVEGIDSNREVVGSHDGLDGLSAERHMPSRERTRAITLVKAWSADRHFADWRRAIETGNMASARRSVTISLNGPDGTGECLALESAWPVKWTGPAFNANASAVASESLEIAYERMTMTPRPCSKP